MKRLNKITIICLFLLITNTIISAMLFIYGEFELYSGYIPHGSALSSNNSSKKGAYMLSYGPYHRLRNGYYMVVLKYQTDAEGNIYQIYSDESSVVYEGMLDKNTTHKTIFLKEPDLNLQVLTFYSGSGTLQVDGVMVIPIMIIVLSLFSLALFILFFLVKNKKQKWINRLFQAITIVLVFSNMFYVDSSASFRKNGLLLPLLLLANIIALLYYAWDKIQYRELIFILSFVNCWIIEWKNVINYGTRYTVLFLSAAIACIIFSLCYVAINNTKKYVILMTVISVLFMVYSTIQYAYYTYFKDFFTIKVVRLTFAAMEASSSIAELIDGEVLSYLLTGGVYLLFTVLISFGYKLRKKNRLVG